MLKMPVIALIILPFPKETDNCFPDNGAKTSTMLAAVMTTPTATINIMPP
jgi:hypothetical protein